MSIHTTDNATAMKIRNHSGNADLVTIERASGKVGIGTSSPTAPLTILSTGWEHLNLVSSDADATNKTGYLTVGHYTNAQESFGIISGQSTTSSNVLNIGGGAAGLNAATSINLYTAANNTTVTGTPRVSIDASGNVDIKTVGSAASPSLHFGGDSDTGLFKPVSNILAFSTFGEERMRIDASGNVGIGSSAALTSTYLSKAFVYTAGGANFAIGGSSNTNNAVLGRFTSYNIANSNSGNESSANFYGVTSIESIVVTTDSNAGDDSGGSLLFKTKPEAGALTERMRIDASGKIQIGNNIPMWSGSYGGALVLKGNNATSDRYAQLAIVDSAGAIAHQGLIVDTNGNLLVGTTSATGSGASSGKQVIQFNGAVENGIYFDDTRTASGTSNAAIFGRGATAVGRLDTTLNSVALTSLSDERVKNNIVDAPSASDDIDAIQVRSFDWKSDGSHQKYGMVAQELLEVAPEAVSVPEDPEEMMGVDYSKLVPMMLKEIQSLRARVAQLES
jgi:hypothetical protein